MSEQELALYEGGGVAVSEHAWVTRTGLQLSDDVPEEELRRIAAGFNLLESAKSFAVGDLANFYRERYPREYRQWLSSFSELDEKTIKVYAAVCAAFPEHDYRARFVVAYEGRRALSFSHFSAVRRYSKEQREHFLERAASLDLSLEQMNAMIEDEGNAGLDEAPPVPQGDPDSVFGLWYALGPHRLLCGDATVPEHLAGLLGEERASMVWTDPPYGVDYVGKTADALTIQHDDATGLRELLVGAWRAAAPVLIESAPFYVAGPTGDNAEHFIAAFREAGWRFQQQLVWVKNRMIMGRQNYHLQHEAVYHGHGPGTNAGRMTSGRRNWYGDDSQTSIFEVPSPAVSREHPTMKPVKLIMPAIENSSLEGEIVLDPFAGSGSTMIAADMTGRRAFMVEYDPHYADVIVARWERWEAEKAARGIGAEAVAVASETDIGPGAFEE